MEIYFGNQLRELLKELNRTTKPACIPETKECNGIDSKFIEARFEIARLHEIVLRQMWVENEKYSDGECIFPTLDKKEVFALGMVSDENFQEATAIFFIRKGVKAHYEELRREKNEQPSEIDPEKRMAIMQEAMDNLKKHIKSL
jgi:hypothetical protein